MPYKGSEDNCCPSSRDTLECLSGISHISTTCKWSQSSHFCINTKTYTVQSLLHKFTHWHIFTVHLINTQTNQYQISLLYTHKLTFLQMHTFYRLLIKSKGYVLQCVKHAFLRGNACRLMDFCPQSNCTLTWLM